jgi:MFS family permease
MVQTDSLKALAVTVGIFFFASNLSGIFLPIYYKDSGLSLLEILTLLFFTFIVIGLLPFTLLRTVKNFEGVISFGIFSTMLFYIVLIFIKNPVILGLTYGLGIATFWPSFNLLQFRLSESKMRARTISIFSSVIPAIASVIGPATGGFIAQNFGFTYLFVAAVVLYLIAFLFSLKMHFTPETRRFSVPHSTMFKVFFVTFIILGLSESYWVAYPFFVLNVSGTVLNMGLIYAFSAIIISAITFAVNWFSDVRRTRVKFAVVGALLSASWYFCIALSSTTYEVVALSLISGLAGAFSISWFAHYGDSFGREYYASILVMMEMGLMIGRITNLAPTYAFISKGNYQSYFMLLGVVALALVPIYHFIQKRK